MTFNCHSCWFNSFLNFLSRFNSKNYVHQCMTHFDDSFRWLISMTHFEACQDELDLDDSSLMNSITGGRVLFVTDTSWRVSFVTDILSVTGENRKFWGQFCWPCAWQLKPATRGSNCWRYGSVLAGCWFVWKQVGPSKKYSSISRLAL